MTDLNLDELERLAKDATPGPWSKRKLAAWVEWRDAAYIAAVSPDVVLALIERLRKREDWIRGHSREYVWGREHYYCMACGRRDGVRTTRWHTF